MERAEIYANEKLKHFPMNRAITITHDELEKMLQDAFRAGEANGAARPTSSEVRQ